MGTNSPLLLACKAYALPDMHGAQVLAWLHCKVRRTAATLRAGGGAFASMDDAALAAYAAGLLGEWLSPAWQGKLSAAHGLPASGAA